MTLYAKLPLHGLIGPYYTSVAKSISYVCRKLNILQVYNTNLL